VRPCLRYLTPEDDQLLGDLAVRVAYSPGDVIVRAGSPFRTLLVLRRGTVRVRAEDEADDGAGCRLPAVDILGVCALLGEPNATMSIVAESEVQADALDLRLLDDIIATRPGFAARLFRGMAHVLHTRLARRSRRHGDSNAF
jgi:CRP-like cAMP-binding protein